MAFAKLSGALLGFGTAPAAPRPALSLAEACAGPSPTAAAAADDELERLSRVLKSLKLTVFAEEYENLARQCAAEGLGHARFLLRLAEAEVAERQRRLAARLVKEAQFPAIKSLDSFDFAALPGLDRRRVLQLAGCDYVARAENVIAVGGSGTGKTHIALGLGLAACQKGLSVGFTTAAALVNELLEAQAERRLLRLQRRLAGYKLLIIDELGYVPLPTAGVELLFDVLSQRCERGSTMTTSDLPPAEWRWVFGSERLTGALVDRLTQRVHVLEMSGPSYRARAAKRQPYYIVAGSAAPRG